MKKIILLFAVTLSVCMTSCQIEDDNEGTPEPQDQFVGAWKITQVFEDGEEVPIEGCDGQDRIEVTADSQFSATSHILENGMCTLEDTFYGMWKNLGDNTYKINPEDDDLWPIEAKITFSGNTMTFVTFDEDGEFKQIFIRV